MKRDNFQAELVILIRDKIFRLIDCTEEQRKKLCDPKTKVFVMISGVPHSKRSRRKRKYKRVAVDPLDRDVCYKVTPRKMTPRDDKLSGAWLFTSSPWAEIKKGVKPIGVKGKRINLNPDIYFEAMRKVERQLEAIIG
jgi:hypothetical protein